VQKLYIIFDRTWKKITRKEINDNDMFMLADTMQCIIRIFLNWNYLFLGILK